ncbi:hypothetical protein [uncultured Sphingomonas sp.]|uniref:hypothetical protein n=1 Tax=uncultured Sphingomonas sp. TaxID=158754 RepID=UPI0035CAC91A
MTPARTIGCDSCGVVQGIPVLDDGKSARCVRCGSVLERRRGTSIRTAMVLSIAALMIVGWLALRALTDRRIDIELLVPSAQGVRTGDTHVDYKGLEIGSVSDIRPAIRPHSPGRSDK